MTGQKSGGLFTDINLEKNKIRRQLHLSFFTPLMALKNQIQTGAICNLCKISQIEQHQEMLSCMVIKSLFNRFQILLTATLPENLDEKEMALGLEIDRKK